MGQSIRCEGCGFVGDIEYIDVRTTNGMLHLCRQCLDDVNRKNPETKRLRSALENILLMKSDISYVREYIREILASILIIIAFASVAHAQVVQPLKKADPATKEDIAILLKKIDALEARIAALEKVPPTPVPIPPDPTPPVPPVPVTTFDDVLLKAWSTETAADKNSAIRNITSYYVCATEKTYGTYQPVSDGEPGTFQWNKVGDASTYLSWAGPAPLPQLPAVQSALKGEWSKSVPWAATEPLDPMKRDRIYTTAKRMAVSLAKLPTVEPGPGPEPIPPVPKKIATALTFVVKSPDVASNALLNDQAFRAWLKGNGIGVYRIKTDAEQAANPRFAGVADRTLVVQASDHAVIGTLPMTTADAAKAFVSKYLPAGK